MSISCEMSLTDCIRTDVLYPAEATVSLRGESFFSSSVARSSPIRWRCHRSDRFWCKVVRYSSLNSCPVILLAGRQQVLPVSVQLGLVLRGHSLLLLEAFVFIPSKVLVLWFMMAPDDVEV